MRSTALRQQKEGISVPGCSKASFPRLESKSRTKWQRLPWDSPFVREVAQFPQVAELLKMHAWGYLSIGAELGCDCVVDLCCLRGGKTMSLWRAAWLKLLKLVWSS